MRISYFREFITLAKVLNFSLAAKQLHMTQPGLSRHISSLENEIGAKLFKRDTHQVILTESGKHFLEGIQRLVDDYDFLCESVKKGGVKKITIGVPYYGVNRYLSTVMSRFKAAYPRVKIDYLPSYPDEIIAALFSLQVDVAVLPRVNFVNCEDLVFHDAFDEPLTLMVNRNHPLAGKDGVRLNELQKVELTGLKGSFGDALYERLCTYCHGSGFDAPPKTNDADTIEAAALNIKPDAHVMILPGHLRESNISENVKWIEVLDEDLYLTISLVHHPDNQNPIIDTFIDYYLKFYASDPLGAGRPRE
jgi:DNA-binding transcriptional LysR family regulator